MFHDDDRLRDDDPLAPPTEEELARAAHLRDELEAPAGAADHPRPPEAAWLAAHLRAPREDDLLGDLRARHLLRAAREAVVARQAARRARQTAWRRVGRGLWGTGGLLALAAALLLVSSVLLEHAWHPEAAGALQPAALRAGLLRASFLRKESATERLNLMIEDRLQALRAGGYRAPAPRGGLLAAGGAR